jgi:hypothetical protein
MGRLHRFAVALRTALGVATLGGALPSRRGVRRTPHHAAAVVPETLEHRTLLSASPAPSVARGATNPAVIKSLAAEAYLWGLAPEFALRFSTYNTTVGAPINTLDYLSVPAAWNNPATQAGDASVLYLNGFLDFSRTPALVLTVPPSRHQYYVVNYLDDYLNTIGSIGTRTTPSDVPTSYLLVGPNSPYAKFRTVAIRGYTYRVMASDTNFNWMVIRVAANTLADAADPQSVPSVYRDVSQKFALNTLAQFERNDHQPVYPTNYQLPPPTPEQVAKAAPFRNAPKDAVRFFRQLGGSVKNSPIPTRFTALSGTALKRLPAWVVPQYCAKARYFVPSYGQRGIFRTFAPLGLTRNGYRIPSNWGPAQLHALQVGYEQGQRNLQSLIASGNQTKSSTNYWKILNTIIGTYPNNQTGYEVRSAIVINGGSANIPLDAVYPGQLLYQGTAQLDGNNTYSITFTPAGSSGPTLPAKGIYPPLVSDRRGSPIGFWAITLYQPDPSEAAAPFLSQASVLNTHYSAADTAVLAVDARTDTLTVRAPAWGPIVASTPLLFGANAASYGLRPNTVYYVATAPKKAVDPVTRKTTYSFKVSARWRQRLSSTNVPIQDSGVPGPIVALQAPGGADPLTYGLVKPVAQLGSKQLSARKLARNADGSLTLWFGPSLPAGVHASNWIPTPSTAYFQTIYPKKTVSTQLQIILRMYYPTPGNDPPSILPYQSGSTQLPESYIPPVLVQVS